MTKKVYRTAQGKMVDLGALQLRNENIRAVGNMKINARGDLIDSNNRSIDSRNQQVARQYRRQTTNTSARQVPGSINSANIPTPPEDFDDGFEKNINKSAPKAAPKNTNKDSMTATPEDLPAGQGLAAAIARARQVKQEPLKTPRQIAQQTPGVRKI